MKYITYIPLVSTFKRLLILTLFIFLPFSTHAFISFPTKIDTQEERINIQKVLNTIMSPSPNLKTDGVLGKKSIQAIQAFQESHNLTPDGKVGPSTRATLESAQTGITTPTTLNCTQGATFDPLTGLPCTTPTQLNITRTLKLTVPRMTGSDIKELQTYLNSNGYNVGTPDGVYGTGTSKAITLFQQSKNLTADGSLGPKTLSYLTKLNPTITLTTGCLSSTGFNTITGLPCFATPTTPTTPTTSTITPVVVVTSSGGGSSHGGGSSTPPDTTKPIITLFSIPTTSSSLTVSVTLSTTDNTGVTGYALTESSSTPSSFSSTLPTTYTFSSQGSKTLYVWAKDAAGNISTSLNDSVTITLLDTTKPIVTAFIVPTTATSLTVPITTFTATDNVAVTGYLLTETSSTPSASDIAWTSSAPTSYTFGSILGAYKYNFTQNLKQGTTNEEVKQLQIYLNNHGYPVSISGPGSLGKETNYFGLNTKQAVIKFQQSNNLIPDGIVGQNTRSIVNK